jgi:uncharacterized membrane protein YukC
MQVDKKENINKNIFNAPDDKYFLYFISHPHDVVIIVIII